MNIQEFESKLSDKELKEFKERIVKEHKKTGITYECIVKQWNNFRLIVAGAFPWDSDSDIEKWGGISKR